MLHRHRLTGWMDYRWVPFNPNMDNPNCQLIPTRDQGLHKLAAFKTADMWAGLDSNGGGGYLNPTISQLQYIIHSLNPIWCTMYWSWEMVGFKYPPPCLNPIQLTYLPFWMLRTYEDLGFLFFFWWPTLKPVLKKNWMFPLPSQHDEVWSDGERASLSIDNSSIYVSITTLFCWH